MSQPTSDRRFVRGKVQSLLWLQACIPLFFFNMGCSRSQPREVLIENPTETNTFIITAMPSAHRVHGLSLHFKGFLDGTAYVWGSSIWQTQALTGNVDRKVYHDYFHDECTIHFEPSGVRTGSLRFEYEFH